MHSVYLRNDSTYNETDLSNGLIIDITADQFEDFDEPVYVGGLDYFHNSFVFVQAHDYEGLENGRLYHLYMTIKSYLRVLQCHVYIRDYYRSLD